MGFIDYQGTKEDRYTDVLEFAKAQQEEDLRRRKDAKVAKWLEEIIGSRTYSELSINDILKFVIVKYRSLHEKYVALIANCLSSQVADPAIVWNDFCLWMIRKQLEVFSLPIDKRDIYFQTMSDKVFKLSEPTSAEVHYEKYARDEKYKRYFLDCFDMVQEKQFWKWLGDLGGKDVKRLCEFIDNYEQLSTLFSFYMFQGLRPENDEWMHRIDIEKQVLERLRLDYQRGRFKNANMEKLINPLYVVQQSQSKPDEFSSIKPRKPEEKTEGPEAEIMLNKPEVVIHKRPMLDRERFDTFIEKQNLSDYQEACKLLRMCDLPEIVDNIYVELLRRIPVLQETVVKFKDVYEADIDLFNEYYIPEALNLTAHYLEYLDAEIGEKVLGEAEKEVVEVGNKLILSINEKIDEIYKFVSIDMKAQAKALESIMSQDGYVDPNFKIK